MNPTIRSRLGYMVADEGHQLISSARAKRAVASPFSREREG
jgi:hypothetical protein